MNGARKTVESTCGTIQADTWAAVDHTPEGVATIRITASHRGITIEHLATVGSIDGKDAISQLDPGQLTAALNAHIAGIRQSLADTLADRHRVRNVLSNLLGAADTERPSTDTEMP